MAQKELISAKYQKRFIVILAAVVLIESVCSFIFAAQNEYLLNASDGVLQSLIANIALPVLLFVLAFLAIGKATSRLWRTTLALVWASAGMLVNSLAVTCAYLFQIFVVRSEGFVLTNYLYIPLVATAVLYAIGLLLWVRSGNGQKTTLVSKGFQRAYIIMAMVYVLTQLAYLVVNFAQYGISFELTPILYMYAPIVLTVGLAIAGYIYLKPLKSRLQRLFFSSLGVAIAFYVGSAINSLNLFTLTDMYQIFDVLATVISIITFAIFVRVVRKELSRKA